MERLQKLIAKAGIASRRKAEELILAGRVKVNGEVVNTLGAKAQPSDLIEVDNKKITLEEKVYFVLYKPTGVISTTVDQFKRDAVVDLIKEKESVYPVGRLDYDTSGVLLLTNDGDFANMLMHPRYKIEKEYYVKIKGLLRKETSKQLSRGFELEGELLQPAKIRNVKYDDKKENTFLHIIITEGKYHQVKKMFAHFGHEVLKLKRVRYGSVTLDGLFEGQYRTLKPHEIKTLYNLIHNKQ
ncbi:MAG: pseudouridine synthase [Candidatus Izemoplasmatales bacterium]|jgi:23S rRNA pseudouridine2605 synthase|nr:pseudouridine synthase [Candidatus Izemoplasmatales bacterium]